MRSSDNNNTWVKPALIAIAVAILWRLIFGSALIWALIIGAIVGVAAYFYFGRAEQADEGSTPEPAPAPAPAPAPTAQPAPAAPVAEPVAEAETAVADAPAAPEQAEAAPAAETAGLVKQGTLLSGESELAARKGNWTYQPS